MEKIIEKYEASKIKFFEALLKENDSCSVCSSDFSDFTPEKVISEEDKKKEDGAISVC